MLAGKKTKVGIAVPQMFPYGPVDMGFVEEHLRLVESLGYDSVWTQDSVLGTMDTLDPFTLLAYASTVTERVGLGISVLVLPFQNPVHLAKISASLDQLSNGRLMLGVGIGGHEDRYPSFGFDDKHRVTRFEHTVELLKRLWTEPHVTFKDRFWDLGKREHQPQAPPVPPTPYLVRRPRRARSGTCREDRGRLDGGGVVDHQQLQKVNSARAKLHG